MPAFSADMAELAIFLVILITVGATAYLARRRRVDLWMFVPAFVLAVLNGSAAHWDETLFYFLWGCKLSLVGFVASGVYARVRERDDDHRRRLSYAVLTMLMVVFLLMFPGRGLGGLFHERGPWMVLWAVALVPALPLAWLLLRAGERLYEVGQRGTAASPANPVGDEDERLVLQMLRDGKIDAAEARELLGALPKPPADRRPADIGVLTAVGGAILVAVGFVLPWAFVRIKMPNELAQHMGGLLGGGQVTGHQAGYHVGWLGWLILLLGLLPAILACISALDRVLRQAMLRAVLAATGVALTLSLCLKQPVNVGIWVCLVGFGIQLGPALPAIFSAARPERENPAAPV